MVGKVFISCGQRPPRETNVAERIGKLLYEKFGLGSYIAFKIQGFDDIMTITDELKSSDYYLFVDFLRREESDLPCSLFTHQEFALAHHLGFKEMIAFQEKGAPLEGFLKYVLSNPEPFETDEELLVKIEEIVRQRKWSREYSRNLVLGRIESPTAPLRYGDHTGIYNEFIWHVEIENRRPDVAAVNALCILEAIEFEDKTMTKCNDRSYLKWAGISGYQRTILPQDREVIDAFSVHLEHRGIFLHSAMDVTPRQPILLDDGRYRLHYEVFSEGFPILPFCIEVDFRNVTGNILENFTDVRVIN